MTLAKMTALDRIIDALRSQGKVVNQSSPDKASAQCPSHDDENPSLSLGTHRNGQGAVLHCFANCSVSDILAALNLTERDLWDDPIVKDALWPIKDYVYPNGRINHRRVAENGKKTFWQEGSDDKSLYGSDLIKPNDTVYLCEGEKGADFLRALGYTAVATGGAQRTCDVEPLRGHVIMIIADRDDSGLAWAKKYAQLIEPIALWVGTFQAKVDKPKADIVDHFNEGYGLDELEPLAVRETNGHHVDKAVGIDLVAAEAVAPKTLEDIEEGFWESRESLKIIFDASMARMCSPWSVLAFCAANALHQVRPHWRLPPVIGGPGSLNWFAAVVDRSGGGKTVSKSLASQLVTGDVYRRNLGSGEGITTAYHKPAEKKGDPPTTREAVHFDVDEISILSGLSSRSGSTTISVLKTAFSGEQLGFSYVSRDVHIEAHSYRMTLIVGVQPAKAYIILDDEGGGLPQRFMWFPANDSRIKASLQSDWIPSPIVLPRMDGYPRTLSIPDEVRELIKDTREANAHGKVDALNGHAVFCREKFAYALALLDGRVDMSSADWELSGIASNVSDFTRLGMIDELRKAQERDARERGRMLGISGSASDEEKVILSGERAKRIARWILKKLGEKGPLAEREIHRMASGRDRPWIREALTNLKVTGVIDVDSEGAWRLLS